jgi:tetratricopeptide (TPR) repeat protein
LAAGSARAIAGDIAGARAHFAEELTVWTSLGSAWSAAITTANLAEAEFQCGEVDAALRHAAEALAEFRAQNYTHNLVHALGVVAAYLIAVGRYDEATARAAEALELAWELQLGVFVVRSLQHVAAIVALRTPAQPASTLDERAARLLGFVDARLSTLEAKREYTEQQEYDRMIAALRAELRLDELERFMAVGATMTEEEAIDLAFTALS